MRKKGIDYTSDYLHYKVAYKVAFDLIDKRNRIGLLIMFGINTGLRYSDLSRIHDRDIKAALNNNNELIVIEKKTKKRRTIYINKILIENYNKFPQVGYLFRSQKGTIYDISYINVKLKKLFRNEKKRNVSTHSLRKTFGRTFYDNSEDKNHALIKLGQMFNHDNIKDTRVYLGINKEETNEVYKQFENLI